MRSITKTFTGVDKDVAVAQSGDLKDIYFFHWNELVTSKLRDSQQAVMLKLANMFQKVRVLNVKTIRYFADPVNADRTEPRLTKRWCVESFGNATNDDKSKLTNDLMMLNHGAKCRRWKPMRRWIYRYTPRWTDNKKTTLSVGAVDDYSIAPRSKKKWFQTKIFDQVIDPKKVDKLEPASAKRFEVITNEGDRTVKFREYKTYTLQFMNMDFDQMD